MTKVNFKYDYKKDAWAWVVVAKGKQNEWGMNWRKEVDFIPRHLLDKILKNGYKKAEVLVAKYIASNPKKNIYQSTIKEQLKAMKNIWKKIEGEYFKRLAKITQKPIYWNNFTCYLTTGRACPYNREEKMFMGSMWHPVPAGVTNICHEIFHMQFLHYYENYCRKFLSEQQKENLKEAITFMLNTDFNDLIVCYDAGFPGHEELRKRLRVIWEEDKNFQRFLDKAIKIVKNV